MKKFLFALIFCCSAMVFRAEAASYDNVYKMCMEEKRPVKLNMKTSFGKLKYDRHKDSKYLGGLIPHKDSNSRIFGLAVASLVSAASLDVKAWETPEGYTCVVPVAVNLFVGYYNPTIYISREAQRSRCDELLTMRHEQTHMQINILVLEYFLPQMKELALRYMQLLEPFLIDTRNQDVNQEANKEIEPLRRTIASAISKINQYRYEEQGKLDNENNYAFESAICNPIDMSNQNLKKELDKVKRLYNIP